MSPTGEDGGAADLRAEAREILDSARELLLELVEEGVDRIEARAPEGRHESAGDESAAEEERAHTGGPAARTPRTGAPGDRTPDADAPARAPGPAPQGGLPGLAANGAAGRRFQSLEAVREELGDCTRCRLCEGRRQIVFGDGHPEADLMFVGEGPGEQEDLRGIPFCGRAGDLLTAMIERGLGIPRSDVYICNIVKCRPPRNRTPLADEVAACRPFLDGQIDTVRPRAIVALGKPAASLLLGRDIAITKVRGTWHEYRGVPVMPTFHPAFLLRQYTADNRRAVWDDLRAALARARE